MTADPPETITTDPPEKTKPTEGKLITDVLEGRKSSAEAEAEAIRLGFEPFAFDPDPALFDPMTEAYWSIPMTLAWISLGDVNAVRECWDRYRNNRRHWVATKVWWGKPSNSMSLEVYGFADSKTVEAILLSKEKALPPVSQSWRDLTYHLESDHFRARAVDSQSRESIEIDPILWKTLEPALDETGFILKGSGKLFQKIDLSRKALLNIWPIKQLPKSNVSSREALTKDLAVLLIRSPNMIKDEAIKQLKSKHPGMSVRDFRANIWPDARERAGLPRKATAGAKPKSTR